MMASRPNYEPPSQAAKPHPSQRASKKRGPIQTLERQVAREPPGPDVLPEVRWYPLVKFWQLKADIAHVNAFRQVTATTKEGCSPTAGPPSPPRWSQDDTDRPHTLMAAEAEAAPQGFGG